MARGGARAGAGRKRTADKFARPVARAEKECADHLPQVIDNLKHLADGGYERIEERWEPAGMIFRDDWVSDPKKPEAKPRKTSVLAFPELPADQMVLIQRTVSIVDSDRAANTYLADRIMGRPTERQEIEAAVAAVIEVRAVDYREQLEALAPVPSGPSGDGDPAEG